MTTIPDDDDTFKVFWYMLEEWSEKQFSSSAERGPHGPLAHLALEVEEALNELEDTLAHNLPPSDKFLEELIDCQHLIFDTARRAGFSYEQFTRKLFEKLEINKRRQWTENKSDKPVEHKR